MKRLIHRLVLLGEGVFDALFVRRRKRVTSRFVEPHMGYATEEDLVLRGRVLARSTRRSLGEGGRLANLRNMIALFLTNELVGIEVHHGTHRTRSDEEGYFRLPIPRFETAGWHDVSVQVSGAGAPVDCPVLVPRADARFMVVSDIDDTVLETGAHSLLRNLWTTFTGSAATRKIFPDAVALMNLLSENGRNPIYYVSSSPWNLHAFLVEVFERAGLQRGPMFLRDFGISETKFITSGHGTHKGESIDILLTANASLPAILIGDTGQKDAEIYAAAVRRHPGRIRAVILRAARPGRSDSIGVADFELAGVPVFAGPDFSTHAPELAELLGLENGQI